MYMNQTTRLQYSLGKRVQVRLKGSDIVGTLSIAPRTEVNNLYRPVYTVITDKSTFNIPSAYERDVKVLVGGRYRRTSKRRKRRR